MIKISVFVIAIAFLSGCVQQGITLQKEDVSINNFTFNPASITIKTGTTVTWTNEDSAPHIVTSDGNFDSSALSKGETFNYTFNTAGTFNYICSLHPSMKGKIIVEE